MTILLSLNIKLKETIYSKSLNSYQRRNILENIKDFLRKKKYILSDRNETLLSNIKTNENVKFLEMYYVLINSV